MRPRSVWLRAIECRAFAAARQIVHQKVVKGDKTLYRARFAGLDKGQAEAACRTLKHEDIPCILVAGK